VWFGRIGLKANRRRKRGLRLSKAPLQTPFLILGESLFVLLLDFLQIFTGLDNHALVNTQNMKVMVFTK